MRTLGELRPIAGLVPTVGGGIAADGHPYVEHDPGAGTPGGTGRGLAAGSLDLDDAVRVTVGLLGALADLHAMGLVHGGVRPAALGRGADGPVLAGPVPLVVAERLGGALAPAFAAPEVLQGGPPTAAADVFAAAALLVHLATGRPPWSDAAAEADTVLLQITSGAAPGLGSLEAHPALAGAVRRALAADPARRPAAGDLRTAIETGGPVDVTDPDQLDTFPPPFAPSPSPTAAAAAGLPRPLGPGALPGPGMRVGSFCVLGEPLGRGATGTVFRATHAAAGEVAVKVLRTDLTDDPVVVDRFVGERATLKRIDHPNVVRVLDLVAEGTTVAIVMELVDGPDLRRWLRNAPALTPAAACALLAQLADALHAVHDDGVVHRDLKAENVLLERVGPTDIRVRLTDFGIAYSARDTQRRTGHGQVVGTPDYLAPEVATGATAGPPADVYALGVVAYELLAGCRPFGTADAAARLLVPPAERAPAPRPPGLDDGLWALVAACLADDPRARPTAAVVATALAGRDPALDERDPALDAGRHDTATRRHETDSRPTETGIPLPLRPPGPPADDARRRRALRWGAAAAAAAALVTGVAVGALTGDGGADEPPPTTAAPESMHLVYLDTEVVRVDAHTIRLTFPPVEGAVEYSAVRDPEDAHVVIPTESPAGGSTVTLADEANGQDHCYVIQALVLEDPAAPTTTAPSPLGPTPDCTEDDQP